MSAVLLFAACAPKAVVTLKRGYDFARVKRVAVLGFDDYPRQKGSGNAAGSVFERHLLGSGYSVVERRQVDRLLEEQRLGASGAVDPGQVREIGRLLGVDALVLGTITAYAPARERTVLSDVREERREPILRKVHRRKKVGEEEVLVEEEEISGYNTIRTVRQEPRTVTRYARVGVTVRMVEVATGEVLWIGSASEQGHGTDDALDSCARRIFAALRPILPAAPK